MGSWIISGLIKLAYSDRLFTVYSLAHFLGRTSEDVIINVQCIGKNVE